MSYGLEIYRGDSTLLRRFDRRYMRMATIYAPAGSNGSQVVSGLERGGGFVQPLRISYVSHAVSIVGNTVQWSAAGNYGSDVTVGPTLLLIFISS